MKCRLAFVAVAGLVSAASASVQSSGDHPVEKVIKLLQSLTAKTMAEGKTEALSYQKFEKWCADSEKTLAKAIAGEKESVSSLESNVAAKEQEVATLTREIVALEKELVEYAATAARSSDERDDGAALYKRASEDYSSTIKAIKDAIVELEKAGSALQVFGRPKVQRALALLEAAEPDGERRTKISALLQRQRPDLLAGGDDAAHVQKYAFKSNNVIEMLKELEAKFEDQLLEATKEETNALNQYALAKQARDATTAAAEASKDEKTKALAAAGSALAEYKKDLEDTQNDLAADSNSYDSTQRQCAAKKQEWEERSKVRDGELEALAAAVQILSKATSVRTEAPKNPVPPPSPVDAPVFLQVSDPRTKAVKLLLSTAHHTKSAALERLAQDLAMHMGEEPFAKVNNMIQKMIFHLKNEQKEEDTHKLWCDQELSKSNASKTNKEQRIAELSLQIEAADATIALLTREVEEAQDLIAQITSFVAEATEIREVGKQENALAIKDSQDAQAAIADAVAVLESFYKSSGKIEKAAWEFVQQPVALPDSPATWGAEYTGVSDPQNQPSGIISVLKATGSEFAKMEADTKAQEVLDQKAFDEQIKNSAIEKSRRAAEVEAKNQEKTRLVDKVGALRKTHKEVSGELESVEQYLHDLEPACISGDSTYEERKAARDEEIGALGQAQVILRDAFKEEAPPAESMLAVKVASKKSFLQVNRLTVA